MNAELSKYLGRIDQLNPNTPPAIRNSLASLAYNTGGKSLEPGGLASAVQRGDWASAKQIFQQYDKVTDAAGNKAPLHGLTVRRGQEAQAFDNPNFYKSTQGTSGAQDFGGTQDPRSLQVASNDPNVVPAQQTASAPAQPQQGPTLWRPDEKANWPAPPQQPQLTPEALKQYGQR